MTYPYPYLSYSKYILSFNLVTYLAEGTCDLMQIPYWWTPSRGSQGRERSHQRAEGEEAAFNREFHLDSDEESICYSATINYVRTDGQATKGFQK